MPAGSTAMLSTRICVPYIIHRTAQRTCYLQSICAALASPGMDENETLE